MCVCREMGMRGVEEGGLDKKCLFVLQVEEVGRLTEDVFKGLEETSSDSLAHKQL